MASLIEQKFKVGDDAYGRRVTATRYIKDGVFMWKIEAEAANQRDATEVIWSLTDANLRELNLLGVAYGDTKR